MSTMKRESSSSKKQKDAGVKENNGKEKDLLLDRETSSESSTSALPWLFSSLAIFGDSTLALMGSLLLFLLAVGLSLWMDQIEQPLQKQQQPMSSIHQDPHAHNYSKLGPIPNIDPPHMFEIHLDNHDNDDSSVKSSIVTKAMKTAFENDGVIAIRGLLTGELLEQLDAASKELVLEQTRKKHAKPTSGVVTGRKLPGTQFHTVDIGTIFRQPLPSTTTINDNNRTGVVVESPFLNVALMSQIPAMAADLLQLDAERNDTMRLLRDIFLAKDEDEYICGWHVDDNGFWPATADAPGVNAWIALDDIPEPGNGGGFALAVGSHLAPWKEEAYYVTGAPHYFPKDGFRNAADLFANRTGSGTCNIQTAAPHLYRRMEETKRVYNVQRGDIIFHTRWLFHRTVALERDAVAQREKRGDKEQIVYRRLSLRYGPGSSIIQPGYGLEPSVLWDRTNGGRTADEVSVQDGPWYPQVWPSVNDDELLQLQDLVENKLSVAAKRREVVQKQMRPYRKQAINRQPH